MLCNLMITAELVYWPHQQHTVVIGYMHYRYLLVAFALMMRLLVWLLDYGLAPTSVIDTAAPVALWWTVEALTDCHANGVQREQLDTAM